MSESWGDAVYVRQRISFHVAMLRAIERCAPNMSLRGSFRYGDFHLDCSGKTLSDVDLIFPCPEGDRHAIASRVEEGIAELVGQKVRVSVQSRDTQALLDLDDARFLASGDYLRQRYTACATETLSHKPSYLLGKAVLGVLRASPDERGSEVVARACLPGVTDAWEARLGLREEFGEAFAAEVLECHSDIRRAAQLAEWLRMPGMQALEEFGAELRVHHQIDPWLRALFARLVERALVDVGRQRDSGVVG